MVKRLRRLLMVLAVLVCAMSARAGQAIAPGMRTVKFPGPPADYMYFRAEYGPPERIISVSAAGDGPVYTYDEETTKYVCTTIGVDFGDSWEFSVLDDSVVFSNMPPFPQAGPPTLTTGTYSHD